MFINKKYNKFQLTICEIIKNLKMGRRKAGFTKNNAPKKDNENPTDNRKAYNDIIRENEKFVKYYKEQNVCPNDEFDEFIATLKTDLPSTFRITGSKREAKKMLEVVQGQFITDCLNQGQITDDKPRLFPLPWYPNKLAWQLNLTRNDIRRSEAFYKLHNFLISETEHGAISRQETVSMIPPLLLDVQPHHKVLDMCAAPGSKTAQILEMLHANDNSIPSGYVLANDVDNKRCYMLVHQAKRLNSPCIAIINHDSATLPNINHTLPDGSTSHIRFDRILCDVPCSGDGTLRKNPDIWMKWTPANGLNLHGIQYRILKRSVELLAVGGRIVYSTCSINPIENEAVINRILKEFEGTLRLVDVSKSLPGLKFVKGMDHWLVGNRCLDFYDSYEKVEEKWQTTIRPQMFPPKPEDKEKFCLEKCIRIMPHHQNTGAFFVAVLEKYGDTPRVETVEKKFEPTNKREHEDNGANSYRKKKRSTVFREDPFVFFGSDEPVWNDIKSFYEVSDEFDSRCLLTRCHVGKKKNIYLTSNSIRDLVISNKDTIKFINTGVKAFVRCDNKHMKCAFRIANDGLESVYSYIGESRKVDILRDDLITLLVNDKPEKSPPIETLSQPLQDQVKDFGPGSCVLVYKEQRTDENEPFVLYLSGWRGKTSLRCYMSQHTTVHLLRLLQADTSKYDVNKFKKIEESMEEVQKNE